jgi:hypothetical protein
VQGPNTQELAWLFASLTANRGLGVNAIHITDADLEGGASQCSPLFEFIVSTMKTMPSLQSLSFMACKLRDVELVALGENLSQARSLTQLDLSHNNFGDKGALALGRIPRLGRLELRASAMTAASVQSLVNALPELEHFDVRGCRKLDAKTLQTKVTLPAGRTVDMQSGAYPKWQTLASPWSPSSAGAGSSGSAGGSSGGGGKDDGGREMPGLSLSAPVTRSLGDAKGGASPVPGSPSTLGAGHRSRSIEFSGSWSLAVASSSASGGSGAASRPATDDGHSCDKDFPAVMVVGPDSAGKTTLIKQLMLLIGPGFAAEVGKDKGRFWRQRIWQQQILHSVRAIRDHLEIASTLGTLPDLGEEAEVAFQLVRGMALTSSDGQHGEGSAGSAAGGSGLGAGAGAGAGARGSAAAAGAGAAAAAGLVSSAVSEKLARAISALWRDPVVQDIAARRNEGVFLPLQQHAAYFLDRVVEIARADSAPSPQDILYCSWPTDGLVERELALADSTYRLVGTSFCSVAGVVSSNNSLLVCARV